MWTVTSANRTAWQPCVRATVWRDWGAETNTTFGVAQAPLIEQATQLEFAGGVTARLGTRWSVRFERRKVVSMSRVTCSPGTMRSHELPVSDIAQHPIPPLA